ncbi:MAG: hypothetical protein ACNYNX_10895 [Leucobacter sp.]
MSSHPPSGQTPSSRPLQYQALQYQAPSSPAPGAARPAERNRAPWSLRLAGISWITAGVVFALGPALVVLLLQLQYGSLKRQAFRLAGLAGTVDPTDLLEVELYLAEFDRIEALVFDAAGWVLIPLLIVYVCVALLSLAGYLVFGIWTIRGANWARITGTALCGVSTPIAVLLWLLFASLSWIPLNALWANHAGLVLIALHVLGIAFAWLPPSNAYVRERRARRPRAA